MITFRLCLRMLQRDVRAGELNVLGIALLLAVAALSSVALLADRVEQGLALQSRQLLGGDLLLSADHAWADSWRVKAMQLGLQCAESATFPSMARSNGSSQLAEVKAVSANYPLRGALRTAAALNQADTATAGVPAPGEVWLDERLTAAFGASRGSRLQLGAAEFTVSAVLTQEPERSFNVFALAPRLLLNAADLPATQLIQPASRVNYRLHLAGDAAAVADYRRWAEAGLGRGEKLETLDNARPELRTVLERAQRFLRLAALLAVVLAAVAMGLAADRYMRRHLDACAVLRCFGASGAQVAAIHGGEFLLFGLLVTLAGCGLGWGVQFGLQHLLAPLIGDALPAASWQPWVQGLAVGMTLVAGFALPPLLRLRNVSTLRVLRREWAGVESMALSAWVAGALLLAALMRWMAGEWRLWLIVLGGFALAVALYALLAWATLVLLRRMAGHNGSLDWRYGVANLCRRRRSSIVQAVALGLGLTALLLLTVARDDLLATWKGQMPANAPNRFIINIQPEQRAELSARFAAAGLPQPALEPMVRGRLVSVNGVAVGPESYADERARRLVEREFNLSWSERLPDGNSVTAGRWHGAGPEAQFSVEQGLADTLGLKPGDALGYDIAGRRVEARITSLRKLDWDSMRVNFFVMAPPGVLEPFPVSYITSFYLPAERTDFVAALTARFPNLTLIDVAAILRQLQETLDQVARAVQAVFGFALLAGLAVLYAALQASADERIHEVAVLRALGARSTQLRRVLAAEFALLGLLAGLLAGAGAGAIATALARGAFRLAYAPDPLLPVYGMATGLVLVLCAGLLGARGALRSSPLEALREAV
ncbi:MAG: ABC transporter permease [Rhodocyclaceae bacterium]|nr:ABC transporter permease [Rhodocyclaceae bacterium]